MAPASLETARLSLVPVTTELAQAIVDGAQALAQHGWQPARCWPGPDLLDLLRAQVRGEDPPPSPAGWGAWIMVRRAAGEVVGDAGFHGRPNGKGEVEIGYFVAPDHRGWGLATEAAESLVRWALAQGATAVLAHCDEGNAASARVLTKVGFRSTGTHQGEMTWRLDAAQAGSARSYDYTRRQGELALTWNDFACLSRLLAERLSSEGVDTVVGIARAGLLPATAVACALRLDLYPVRITRREGDVVCREHPVWKVPVSPEVSGRRVAVVDEIADSGETLEMVRREALRLGAASAVTACLVRHSWAKPVPDICALVSDALVVFPWDAQVYGDGAWSTHPEIAAARRAQDRS